MLGTWGGGWAQTQLCFGATGSHWRLERSWRPEPSWSTGMPKQWTGCWHHPSDLQLPLVTSAGPRPGAQWMGLCSCCFSLWLPLHHSRCRGLSGISQNWRWEVDHEQTNVCRESVPRRHVLCRVCPGEGRGEWWCPTNLSAPSCRCAGEHRAVGALGAQASLLLPPAGAPEKEPREGLGAGGAVCAED